MIAEPRTMIRGYAHKGAVHVIVTSRGITAHSSTDKGVSANFQMARFMAEMADLKDLMMQDKLFMNDEFDSATNGFNITITEFDTPRNATAPLAICRVGFHAMPQANNENLIEMITTTAEKYGLEHQTQVFEPLVM